MTSFQRAAMLQALLEGVPLPASRDQLIDYGEEQDGGQPFRPELERLPDRDYRALDEVGEALAPVQPSWDGTQPHAPERESGLPPGGDAYTDAAAEPGAVRERGPRG
jgi:Protein of unknown function (DUF2795)